MWGQFSVRLSFFWLVLVLKVYSCKSMHSLSIYCRVLNCCTCQFHGSFPFLFILASSVCKSLQSLISTLKRGGERGHLFTVICSAVCGKGGTLQTNTPGMSGECLYWMDHTGFATVQGGGYFLGPYCSGSRVFHEDTVPSGPCISCTFQA